MKDPRGYSVNDKYAFLCIFLVLYMVFTVGMVFLADWGQRAGHETISIIAILSIGAATLGAVVFGWWLGGTAPRD